MATLGELMRVARASRSYSLRQLAGVADLSAAYLSGVETGKHTPSEPGLGRILTALGVPMRDRDRWYAAAGIIPAPIRAAMLARPESWGDVRSALETIPQAVAS